MTALTGEGWEIRQGDVFDVLATIPPRSVDCCVTSPPYWRLRDYLMDNPDPKDRALKPCELGSEKTPEEFVANMVRVFGLVRETLTNEGTCFINVGDSYSGSGMGGGGGSLTEANGDGVIGKGHRSGAPGIPAGNLCLIPQRLALALQADGWFVRSVIVWHKPSCMPASLSGWRWMRCRVKAKSGKYKAGQKQDIHPMSAGFNERYRGEPGYSAQWRDCKGCDKCRPNDGWVLRRGSWRPTSSYEPILMLAKSARYFCDGDAVAQPAKSSTLNRNQYTRVLDDPDEQFAVQHDHETTGATANLRDVWTIAAESLNEKHYAAFPTELPSRCIQAATSEHGYCPACGMPWVRMMSEPTGGSVGKGSWIDHSTDKAKGCVGSNTRVHSGSDAKTYRPGTTVGFRPSCKCKPDTPRPGVVLDPFCGSGRTGIAARRLFRRFIGIELYAKYANMAARRIRADAPLFNVG